MSLDSYDSSKFDSEQARYDRLNRTNPSEYAPGQGDSMDDLFSNDVSEVYSDGTGNSLFDNPFQNTGSMSFNQQNQQGQSQGQGKSQEDAIFDGLMKVGKYIVSFIKEFVSSFGQVTPKFWQNWGYVTSIVCCAVFFVGLIMTILSLKIGMPLMRGSVLGAIASIPTWFLCTDKARQYSSCYKDDNEDTSIESTDISDNQNESFDFSNDDTLFNSSDDFSYGDDDEDFFTDDSMDDDFSDFDDTDTDFDFGEFDMGSSEPKSGVDMEDALQTMPAVSKGMYTRQYLYEMFTKVLPNYCDNFSKSKTYNEDDETFLYWEEQLRSASVVTGVKEEFLPTLEELSENVFTVSLVCERTTGFKPDAVAKELASIYAFNEGESSIGYKVEPVGMSCYITLYTGKSPMISLKDMYKPVEDFILDANNYMPIVVGVNTAGEVIKHDFKKIESIIVTGMPRKGKSWFVQNILYQMCSYISPKDLWFYICDPKDGISDYKPFVLPHVKGFESDDRKVLELLRRVVKVDAVRRKKIIGDAGCVNIWQYKNRYPDVEMPIIYVVIDEIVTFASRMDKETNQEFRMLLRELISQLPALGIRAFLIPHILNNDIIEKKTSDLVNCRISICGDAEHIEKATGSKPKQFPYKLSNLGDMAVRMPDINPDTMFIHSPVLTNDNDRNRELFDYARRVWTKLEPDSVRDSVAYEAEVSKEQEDLLERMSVDDIMEDIDF